MKVTIRRIKAGKESTLSKLYIDQSFSCYALEDRIRPLKIKGSTAIPAGTYPLRLNTYGAMNARYAKRFPKLHQGMLQIDAIPNYSYVYFHIGNTIADTAGCILLGEAYSMDADGDYILLKSAKAYKEVYKKLHAAGYRGEATVTLTPLED